MVLLDQLEQRLDHCENVVTEMLQDIHARLDTLENDVRSIRADMGGGRLEVEKDLVSLSGQLSRLEGKALDGLSPNFEFELRRLPCPALLLRPGQDPRVHRAC